MQHHQVFSKTSIQECCLDAASKIFLNESKNFSKQIQNFTNDNKYYSTLFCLVIGWVLFWSKRVWFCNFSIDRDNKEVITVLGMDRELFPTCLPRRRGYCKRNTHSMLRLRVCCSIFDTSILILINCLTTKGIPNDQWNNHFTRKKNDQNELVDLLWLMITRVLQCATFLELPVIR